MAITIQEIRKQENGARFYTADLHVHSYGFSADVSDAAMTVEAIIDTAVKSGVSILAIADHNTAQHVNRALEHAARYPGRLLLLPAVEVTTANGHVLVYFAPETPEKVRDLLSRVSIVGEFGARDSHTAKSMADVIGEAERLGGICVAAHIDRPGNTGFEMIVDGYPNWKRDIRESRALRDGVR
jgi:PHP family Zn ribbon phosphoesterase